MQSNLLVAGDTRDAAIPSRARTGRRRLWYGLVLAVLCMGALCVLSLAIGTRGISPSVIWQVLRHPDPGDVDSVVITQLRIPRTLLGMMVGTALGLAGTLMQGLTRNPLADPGLLGVNAGASLAVVSAIGVLGITSPSGYVWFAFGGAAIAAVVVYAIGSMGRDGATPVALALAGAALTALLASGVTIIQLGNVTAFDEFRFWQVGAIAGRDLGVVRQVAPFVAVAGVLALSSGRMLNALALGDDIARSLGYRLGLTRGLVAVAVVLLCGGAVAAAGPIGFVGLAVPHAARLITGPDFRWVLVYSAVLGPILVLGADILGRVVARPAEVQVGVVTAVVGAPVLILLVRRARTARL